MILNREFILKRKKEAEKTMERQVTDRRTEAFAAFLRNGEKSINTVEKYVRDVRQFLDFIRDKGEMNRETVIQYKESLLEKYKKSSVNSMLIAVNCYLKFIGKENLCVRTCRIQRQIFRAEEREMSRKEYERLVREAQRQGNSRLCHIIQTMGATGIRVSELPFITAEALKERKVCIQCKGKERIILLPQSLVMLLRDYCRKQEIRKGSIFITKSGRPIDRRNIWAEMKRLCETAKVEASKVFPHNLRHLFARCYYEREKNLARLADYLGHSSVETTRRYTMTAAAEECRRQLELGLLPFERKKELRVSAT